jgi:hypothetical protein
VLAEVTARVVVDDVQKDIVSDETEEAGFDRVLKVIG